MANQYTKPEFNLRDAIQAMQDAALQQARMPNIYAYKPHPKQLMFHSLPQKERLFVAGNRSGKTLGSVAEGIWWLTKTHPYRKTPEGQIRGRVVAVDFLNGVDKIILPLYKQLIPHEYLIEGSWNRSYSAERHTLTLKDGSFVEFMSQDQDLDKFAGTSRHFVHFDEECPQVIFEECKMRLLDTNGEFWISETPVAGMEWIYDDLYVPYFEALSRGEEPSIGLVEMATGENPYLDTEALERIFGNMSAEARAVRMSGQYTLISGSLYKEFGEFSHAGQSQETFPWDPLRMRLYLTGDHGINNPTAWLWVAADVNGGLTVIRELYETGLPVSSIAYQIKQINAELGVEPYMITLDPATEQRTGFTSAEGRPMTIADEYRRHGINVLTKGIPRDKQIGINKILQYLKQNPKTGRPFLTVLRECHNTIREIKGAKQNRWVNKKIASMKNAPEGQREKDDHTTDALRYLMTFMDDLTPEDLAGTSRLRTEYVAADLLAAQPTWRTPQQRRQDSVDMHGWHRPGAAADSVYAGME
jgi:hypothetical protein